MIAHSWSEVPAAHISSIFSIFSIMAITKTTARRRAPKQAPPPSPYNNLHHLSPLRKKQKQLRGGRGRKIGRRGRRGGGGRRGCRRRWWGDSGEEEEIKGKGPSSKERESESGQVSTPHQGAGTWDVRVDRRPPITLRSQYGWILQEHCPPGSKKPSRWESWKKILHSSPPRWIHCTNGSSTFAQDWSARSHRDHREDAAPKKDSSNASLAS